MSFAGVYKLGEQPTVGERLEETRKVKQGGMGNGTTAKEGLGDLNEMKSVKKNCENCDCRPGHSLIVIH